MTSAQGISFDGRPSAMLARLLGLMVLLATLAPLFTALSFPLRCLIASAVAVFGLWRMARYRRPHLRRVAWVGDGAWTVTDRHGVVSSAELTAVRRVGKAVCLSLRWRSSAGHVILLPDNTPPDTLRRLRGQMGRRS